MPTKNPQLMRIAPFAAVGLVAAVLAAGCGGSAKPADTGGSSANGQSAGAAASNGKAVLPVPTNPIKNSSTAPGLTITKALVENNVAPDTGKAVKDHLEVALKNTSAKRLDQIEVYYRISDPKKRVSEGYFMRLDGFSIKPGATRTAHFDNAGAKDHYPVNKYSLYYTGKNALVVDIEASSPNVKPAKFTVKKDAAGAEAGVE